MRLQDTAAVQILAISLLLWSCRGSQKRSGATISLAETKVKLGHEISLRVEHAPDGWWGEINVNHLRHLPIDAAHRSVRVTLQNGFSAQGGTDLFVLLMDRKGHEIPIANHGPLRVEALPAAIGLSPPDDKVAAAGGPGEIRISAAPGADWSVKGLPDWMTVAGDGRGSGSGTVAYRVAANISRQERSAAIEIGDAVFEIAQPAAAPRTAEAAPAGGRDATPETKGAVEGNPQQAPLPTAAVTIDPTAVKMGTEVQIHIDRIPDRWSGEVMVNSLRHFQFDSKLFKLKATVKNGFNEEGPTDLYILLTDQQGRGIPLPHGGRFQITVIPNAVRLDRENRDVESAGASGSLYVTARAGYEWSVQGAPGWLKIASGAQGSGNGTIAYTVAENTTNEARSATLTIGDSTFEISQLKPPAIQLPFHDNFPYNTPPPFIGNLVRRGAVTESPIRWLVDEQPGQHSVLSIKPDAPNGGNSVLIEKQADPRAWATQVVLPAIQVRQGAAYKVSVWMRAQSPGPVTVEFGQRTAPYRTCGITRTLAVSKVWTEFAVPFRVAGEGCEAANNRLTLQVGKIGGQLWIANFSMAPSR